MLWRIASGLRARAANSIAYPPKPNGNVLHAAALKILFTLGVTALRSNFPNMQIAGKRDLNRSANTPQTPTDCSMSATTCTNGVRTGTAPGTTQALRNEI